jgi:hypothetical protein
MSFKPSITIQQMMEEILTNFILTQETKEALMEYIKQEDVHSILGITFKELLLNVWEVINNNINKEEILKVLNLEMTDSICKCFTGRMSRLINCLNGFDDRVNVKIADNEQIGNIIFLVKQKLEDKQDYTIEEHKRLVELEMLERGYTRDVVKEWIEYIE